jgi:uncharacterized C2H2 Zn-finger protein
MMDTYECRACGASFSDEDEFRRHASEAHGESEMAGAVEMGGGYDYACDLCEELFPSRQDLEDHRREHGEAEAA